jgi:hypothetical protein
MTCERVKMPDGSVAIVCYRGGKKASERKKARAVCAYCDQTAKFMCDREVPTGTCDKQFCSRHGYPVSQSKQFCMECSKAAGRGQWPE